MSTANVNIIFRSRQATGKIFVVPSRYDPVLGRTWIRALGIELGELDHDQKQSSDIPINQITDTPTDVNHLTHNTIRDYSSIFEQHMGRVPKIKLSLKLRNNAKPIYIW